MLSTSTNRGVVSSSLITTACFFVATANAQFPPLPVCDTSPDALTEAFAKLNIPSDKPQTVDHTCIESTGYPGERCFYTYVPECATVDSPLVYDIHGVSLCPLWNFETSGWVQKSIDNCFVVVWPEGNNDPSITFLSCFALESGFPVTDVAQNQNNFVEGTEYSTRDCCCNIGGSGQPVSFYDDLTFLRNIAAVVTDNVSSDSNGAVTIDTKRIYMGGHSNGCTAGLAMAAVHSDMVAAVCCHSPALVTPFDKEDYKEVPIWLAHGKFDGTVDYNGAFNSQTSYIPGAEETNQLLGRVNNCKNITTTTVTEGSYTNIIQTDCDNNDARVELMSLDTAGHTPFLGADLFFGDREGAQITTIDTTQHAWEFCSQYSRTNEPILELVSPKEEPTTEPEESDPTTGNNNNNPTAAPTRAPTRAPNSSAAGNFVDLLKCATLFILIMAMTYCSFL